MVDLPFNLPEPHIRTIEDMRTVLHDLESTWDKPLYFMYRDVAKTTSDRQWLQEHNLRYDITVIPPAVLGREFVKTKGHHHPRNAHGIEYPELYEVLGGFGHFLMQNNDLSDVFMVLAQQGDLVLIPAGYGHVTINPSLKETLVMANLVATDFTSEYAAFEHMQGAAYYELSTHGIIRNYKYIYAPPIRTLRVNAPEVRTITQEKSLYDCMRNETIRGILDPGDSSDTMFSGWYRPS
jgi:glucose-6-phosphate isomerase